MGFVAAALAAAAVMIATIAGEHGVEMECTTAHGCFSLLLPAAEAATATVPATTAGAVLQLLDPADDGLWERASTSLVSS